MMLDQDVIDKLKKQYADIHPLIFHRSVEHAKNSMELFEILASFPSEFPVAWEDKDRRWKKRDLIPLEELNQISDNS